MVERTESKLVDAMNIELLKTVGRWKCYSKSPEDIARINTILGLAEKANLEIKVLIDPEALESNKIEDTRILQSELSIYGKHEGNCWAFYAPPHLDHFGHDPYIFSVTTPVAGEESHLLYYQMYHGSIASFKPEDIISITLQ
jgi:hypothetical protein